MQGGPRRGRSPITGPTLPHAAQASLTSPEGEIQCPQGRNNQKNSPRRAGEIARRAGVPNFAGGRNQAPAGQQCRPQKREQTSRPAPCVIQKESATPIYNFAAPTPGKTCSKAYPRESNSPSAKALPKSCMPTGNPLSAPTPTGMESPGRPARFSESV